MLKKMDHLIIGNTSESTKIKNFYKGQHKNTEILERIADIKNLEIAFQAIRKSSSNIVSDEDPKKTILSKKVEIFDILKNRKNIFN